MCAALETHPLPERLIPFACESGVVGFEPGEPYRIAFTILGADAGLSDEVVTGLERVGAERPEGRPPALGGNFVLERHEVLPLPDLAAEAAALAGTKRLTLQLESPLRVPRPKDERVKGEAYLNANCFPLDHFLARLWARVLRLALGREPSRVELAAQRPPMPRRGRAEPGPLLWIDAPSLSPAPGRPKGTTLGGVLGAVELAGLTRAWLPILVLGQYVHVGEGVHFGFGRYRLAAVEADHQVTPAPSAKRKKAGRSAALKEAIGGDPEDAAALAAARAAAETVICATGGAASPPAGAAPYRRARTLLETIADRRRLHAALEHVCTHSTMAGVDGVKPSAALERGGNEVQALLDDLAGGSYRPQPLLGLAVPQPTGKLRAIAAPTVRDRVVQRAACDLLAPAIDTLLEDCSFAYRKGFSRGGGSRDPEGVGRGLPLRARRGRRVVLRRSRVAPADGEGRGALPGRASTRSSGSGWRPRWCSRAVPS